MRIFLVITQTNIFVTHIRNSRATSVFHITQRRKRLSVENPNNYKSGEAVGKF